MCNSGENIMLEDLPDLLDIEYLVSNIVYYHKLDVNSPLFLALKNSYIFIKEVKKGETWNDNGVILKYIQFTFLVDVKYKNIIVDSYLDILTSCKDILYYHGFRHVQWKPIVKARPVESDKHLYNNKDYLSCSGCYYRSKSEVKIAKYLERIGINFIANARGRFRNDNLTKTIEPDFIVFYNGKCAVLEVDGEGFHDNSALENERDRTLLQNIFLFVKHYPASLCYNDPKYVVEDFIAKF